MIRAQVALTLYALRVSLPYVWAPLAALLAPRVVIQVSD